MNALDKYQKEELGKIVNYLKSSDKEIFELGVLLLRTSKIYKKMKPQTLFYYPQDRKNMRIRVSSYVTLNIKRKRSEQRFTRGFIQMFNELMSNNATRRFRREFISTAEIL